MQTNYHIPENIKQLTVSYINGKDMDSGELSVLKDWLQRDPQHLSDFNQLRASWILADNQVGLNVDSDLLWKRIENELAGSKKTDTSRNKLLYKIGYAATWLLVVALTSFLTWMFTRSSEGIAKNTEYIVPIGSKSTVKLPDGSVVWLNAGSKLEYSSDFDKAERNVYLTGEAYFSVMTNKEKPFKVHTSDIIVRALGTKFNVKAYPEEKTITTTLEEGIIDIQVINTSKGRIDKQIKIKPHEKLVFFRDGEAHHEHDKAKVVEEVKKIQLIDKNIKVESNINTELYTSWKGNKWVIEGLALKCLTPMLERRYNVKIHFADDELQHYKFSGILQNETIEQIMDVLRYTAPIKYNIVKDSVYLSIDHKVKHNFERIITTRK